MLLFHVFPIKDLLPLSCLFCWYTFDLEGNFSKSIAIIEKKVGGGELRYSKQSYGCFCAFSKHLKLLSSRKQRCILQWCIIHIHISYKTCCINLAAENNDYLHSAYLANSEVQKSEVSTNRKQTQTGPLFKDSISLIKHSTALWTLRNKHNHKNLNWSDK